MIKVRCMAMASVADLEAQLLVDGCTFSLPQAQKYIADVLATCSTRTGTRFHKRFFYEFVPLVTIAGHLAEPSITIVFDGAGHDLDGRIVFADGRDDQRVELTAAIDGQNEALRMELLAERGHAPAVGPIEYTGAKARGDRKFGPNETIVRDASETARDRFSLVAKALGAKRAKASTRPNYRAAWLGIVIDNYPPTEFKKPRYDPLCAELLSDSTSYAPFNRVFVISNVGDYIFDSASL